MRLHDSSGAHERRWLGHVRLSCRHHPLHDQCRGIPTISSVLRLEGHCDGWCRHLVDDAFLAFRFPLFLVFLFLLSLILFSLSFLLFEILFFVLGCRVLVVEGIKLIDCTKDVALDLFKVAF